MAWYPGAIRKVVTRHRTPMDRHRGICEHVAVSEAASLFNYFNQPGNPTSHFYVRRDGKVEQYVSTEFKAPAQLEGNDDMLSVETQGGTVNPDTEPWTAAQVETLAGIAAWAHELHGIPLQAMTDSCPSSRGVGYHRLGVEPWRKDGCEEWSSKRGKICPGQGKIDQIPGIITRARLKVAGGDDGTMAWTDAQIAASLKAQADTLEEIKALRAELTEVGKDVSLLQVRSNSMTNQQMPELRETARTIRDDVSAIRVEMATGEPA